MTAHEVNRFEWLKAVNRSDLLPSAKLVASALAVEFCNDRTGQLNPSVPTIMDATGSSEDKVKRALKKLADSGWLSRTSGRGRGKHSEYTLLSPGQIIPIAGAQKDAHMHRNKGGIHAPTNQQKGAYMHEKGGTDAPSYIEQTKEQTKRLIATFGQTRFGGNAWEGVTLIPERDRDALYEWAQWTTAKGYPALRSLQIVVTGKDGKGDFFALPTKRPPNSERDAQQACEYFDMMLGHSPQLIAAE